MKGNAEVYVGWIKEMAFPIGQPPRRGPNWVMLKDCTSPAPRESGAGGAWHPRRAPFIGGWGKAVGASKHPPPPPRPRHGSRPLQPSGSAP